LETKVTTRYPKAGKGRPWTIRELRVITAEWRGDTVSDGSGLFGEIRTSEDGQVSVRFKYAFKWKGKVCWYQCGTWPTVDLAAIRVRRDKAKSKLKDGINPVTDKEASKIEAQTALESIIAKQQAELAGRKIVQDLFDAWITDGVARKDGNKELRRLFGKDVLPEIGSIELRKLTANDILALLRKMIEREVFRQAVAAFNDITQMLHWGEKRQPWRGLLTEGNPADLVDMETLLPHDYEEERDRVLSPAELRELAEIFARTMAEYEAAPDGAKYQATRPLKRESELALWICLGTLCRIGELLMAEWKQVDLATGTWFIPKANIKGRRKKKQDHYVFLSDFARRQFVELRKITGMSAWLFPARNNKTHVCVKTISKQVGDRQTRFKQCGKPLAHRCQDDTLVLADGVNGKWTPHDMRRTGATMMQQLGIPLDIIDRCQNHILAGSKVRRHYLHHDYQQEKTEAWNNLGNEIVSILEST
jgi:integrase